jgi:large conductance mechanosensitive channel
VAAVKGFREFILRGNLVDLAVGFVVGAAFTTLVQALVKDLLTPLLAAVGGKPHFGGLTFTVNHSQFAYGDFLNALIAFLMVAAVLYFAVVRPVAALLERLAPKPPLAPLRACPECLSDIPKAARRCRYCTAGLADGG